MTGVFSIPLFVVGFISTEAEGTAALLLCKFIAHGTLIMICGQVSACYLAAISSSRSSSDSDTKYFKEENICVCYYNLDLHYSVVSLG